MMRFYAGPRLLVLDELGYLPLPAEAASALFQVINTRYLNGGATAITTNVGIASWAGAFGDPAVAGAMLDRLLHRGIVIGIDGPSYRLRSPTKPAPKTSAPGSANHDRRRRTPLPTGRHPAGRGPVTRRQRDDHDRRRSLPGLPNRLHTDRPAALLQRRLPKDSLAPPERPPAPGPRRPDRATPTGRHHLRLPRLRHPLPRSAALPRLQQLVPTDRPGRGLPHCEEPVAVTDLFDTDTPTPISPTTAL